MCHTDFTCIDNKVGKRSIMLRLCCPVHDGLGGMQVGAGVLGLPSAMSYLGWPGGVIVLVLSCESLRTHPGFLSLSILLVDPVFNQCRLHRASA